MPIASSVKTRPSGAIDGGARLHAAAGQRNVGGDDNRARPGAGGDPVVGGVRRRAGGDALNPGIVGHADEALRHDAHRKPVAGGDAIHLLLHRAGIGIDIDANGGGSIGHRSEL